MSIEAQAGVIVMVRKTGALVVVAWLAILAPAAAAPSNEAESAQAVGVQRLSLPGSPLRDDAAMMIVGAVLIGLAAVVRRTV